MVLTRQRPRYFDVSADGTYVVPTEIESDEPWRGSDFVAAHVRDSNTIDCGILQHSIIVCTGCRCIRSLRESTVIAVDTVLDVAISNA